MPSDLTALKSTQSWAVPFRTEKTFRQFSSEYDQFFKPDEAPYILYNRVRTSSRMSLTRNCSAGYGSPGCSAADHKPFTCKYEDVVSLKYEELLLAFSITVTTENDEVRIDFNSACSDLFEPLSE